MSEPESLKSIASEPDESTPLSEAQFSGGPLSSEPQAPAVQRMPLLSEIIAEESRKSLASAAPKAIGDRWEILNRLGQGGMSTVYKARHLVMNKVCAVKILNYNLTSKQESLQRFQREAKAASSLNHPNVICVLDCGVTDEQHAFLIMDYLEGESLGDLISREGKLAPDRALPIFLQTCDALAHAHDRSVIHRDLKPSNLMLVEQDGKKDFVKIVDFGIAKLLDIHLSPNEVTHQRLTHTGDIFGSPLYMSPEQCSGSESDRRSDIYSMGCLMYETLSGVPPFVGANTLDTLRLKLSDAPTPSIEAKSDRLLKRLNAVVQKCLQKDPDDRYDTMKELRTDLILARDESDSGWHTRALANRKKWRWSWLKMTPKKVVLLICTGLIISGGTTVYMDSTTSDLPSDYENKSLWSEERYAISPAITPSISEKSDLIDRAKTVKETLDTANSNQKPAAEVVSEQLINKFADADKMRQDKQYTKAANAYSTSLKQWNKQEAEDLPGANWTVTTSKAYFGLGLCKTKLARYDDANDCFQQAIDYAQKDPTMPQEMFKDMTRMFERNQWKVHPVKAMMRVLSKKEMLPPGAS